MCGIVQLRVNLKKKMVNSLQQDNVVKTSAQSSKFSRFNLTSKGGWVYHFSESSKHEDRKIQPHQIEPFPLEKAEKKERSSKTKDKREKTTDEEKELRKERKLGRKRDRAEEALLQEQKRRRDEEKAMKMMSHSNGEMLEPTVHTREKHHHTRDKSPYTRERERSHDRAELRDKHRRSSEGKRR